MTYKVLFTEKWYYILNDFSKNKTIVRTLILYHTDLNKDVYNIIVHNEPASNTKLWLSCDNLINDLKFALI